VDGLCFNAGRKFIEFGKDTSTSCLVKLSLDDLRNCSGVRYAIFLKPRMELVAVAGATDLSRQHQT
jgi:hypothetical protein